MCKCKCTFSSLTYFSSCDPRKCQVHEGNNAVLIPCDSVQDKSTARHVISWSITANRQKQNPKPGNRSRVSNTCKLYLCHIDERRSTVVLPHGSSSSQPEVKVHSGASEEHIRELRLSLWSLLTTLWDQGVCFCRTSPWWNPLIVKSFASCVNSSRA